MGLMDIIRKYSEKKATTKEKFKQAEEEMKIQRLLEERQKSSNRRELERYMKDKEEERIKQALEGIRKKQSHDTWSGKTSMINQKMTILQDDKPILMEKNIFLDNKTKVPLTNKGMFFR